MKALAVGMIDFSFLRDEPRIRLVVAGTRGEIAGYRVLDEMLPLWNPKAILKLIAGEVRVPCLGLELQELSAALKKSFGFAGERNGLLVSDLHKGAPAEQSGIRRGDILMRMEEISLKSVGEYRDLLSEYTPGDRLRLRIFPRGKEVTITAQPSVFPQELSLDHFERRLGIRPGRADQAVSRYHHLSSLTLHVRRGPYGYSLTLPF